MKKKPIIYAVLLCLGLLAVLAGIKFLQIRAMMEMGANMAPPAETVSSYEVTELEWENTLASIGTVEAVLGVMVTAEIGGRVKEILFKAGADVQKGEVLVRQDTSSEKAQLRSAEANVMLTRSNFERTKELFNKKLTSNTEFDTARARAEQAVAERDLIQANIDKKTITAPFAGRLGIRQVNLGQDLAVDEPIVTLQSVDPVFVNFYLPQQNLAELRPGLELRLTTDAAPGEVFHGRVSAVNAEVDEATRNILVQGTLSNPEGKLVPGMYAAVEVVLARLTRVTIVPVTAVSYATFGDSVFLLENNDQGQLIARQQFVQLGETRGDFVAVKAGVEPGQTVASAGVFKLLNNAPVTVNNEVVPEFSLDPTPVDQ